MTHTLHRHDRRELPSGDYVVLAMPARGFPPGLAVEKEKEFLRRALRHRPVNLGDSAHGALHHARRDLGPRVHWRREERPEPEKVIERVDRPSAVAAVFDDLESTCSFLAELKEARLGLSINLSCPAEEARVACHRVGLTRHSVEYSLGFLGAPNRLPREPALDLSTMCGHGMVSAGLAEKIVDRVRSGRRTPADGARTMARFCNCGAFNPARAERILEKLRRPSRGPSGNGGDSRGAGGGT